MSGIRKERIAEMGIYVSEEVAQVGELTLNLSGNRCHFVAQPQVQG